MRQASFHPDVWDDANIALQYYADIDPDLAAALMDEVESAVTFIRRYPTGAATFLEEYRRVALRRFPYIVCYRFLSDTGTIRILAIVHTSRDPQLIRALLAGRR